MPISAVDSISLAIDHTKQQLFKPFRLGQWTKLAFVGLLAGELGANGCNNSNFNLHPHPGTTHFPFPHPGIEPFLLAALITAALTAAFAIGVILLYVGSVMRFILFDSVVAKECHIRWSWRRRLGPGWQYFVWRLGYIFLTLAAIVVVVGTPVAFALAKGWFRAPKEHLPVLVFGGIALFLLLLIFFLATAVILVFTKDFVVPQMALENLDAMEAWRRLLPMMKAEKGTYAAYIVMKIVLALVAAVFIGIATIFLGLIVAIPTAGLGILAILTGKSAGLVWNANTIALAVVVGCILLAGFLYLVSLVYVPAIVFFPAYSIYFFAGRYPRLSALLYSAPPAPTGSPGTTASR